MFYMMRIRCIPLNNPTLCISEHLSPELLVAIAVVVGCILTILILTLIILYAVRAEKCCCGNVDNNKKRHLDIER